MNATYSVRSFDVAQFNKLLANAQKKAVKLGVPPITATFGAPRQSEYVERGVTRYETVVDITIDGATPKYNGWKLVGVVSPLKADDGTILPIVTTVPGETVNSNGQARDPLACDHCKVRRDRLESFIVRHEDGTEKQVGRNCLADFLGDARMSPAGLAGLMNTLASISDSVAQWSKGPRRFDSESLDLVLATTLAVIRNRGWVSSKEAYATGKTPTRLFVQQAMDAFLTAPDTTDLSADDALVASLVWGDYNPRSAVADLPTKADFAAVPAYRENLGVILDTKESTEVLNDYLAALRILNFAGTVNRKAMGIAVSIIPTVDREMGVTTDPVKALVMAAKKTSQYVGSPKKREVFSGLTFIENFQTNSGMTIATLVTADGNLIKLFSGLSLTKGQKVDLKATVTRHNEYQGVKSTIVNRPVVVS